MVHEYVVARDEDGERILGCAGCGARLSGYAGSYKHGALMCEEAVTTIPSAPDPARFIDDPMVLRRFACPGCLTQIATEIARAGDPVTLEMRLALQ